MVPVVCDWSVTGRLSGHVYCPFAPCIAWCAALGTAPHCHLVCPSVDKVADAVAPTVDFAKQKYTAAHDTIVVRPRPSVKSWPVHVILELFNHISIEWLGYSSPPC